MFHTVFQIVISWHEEKALDGCQADREHSMERGPFGLCCAKTWFKDKVFKWRIHGAGVLTSQLNQ